MASRITPVITGRGWITALGSGIEPVMDRLLAGDTGISPARRIDASGLRNDHCGEVAASVPDEPRERIAVLLRQAVTNALDDAGLDAAQFNERGAIVLATSFGTIFHNADGPVALDDVLGETLRAIGLTIEPIVISAACSSSTEALGLGHDLIAPGRCDRVLAIGVDVVDRYKMAGHSSLSTMSPDTCRPFDVAANGTILGEGAAAMILEAPAAVAQRGGTSLGRLLGVASTTDTAGATSPDPDGTGAIRVLTEALSRAGRTAADVGYVNAHGSGTPVNDAMEIKAFTRVFGEAGPLVSSTKSAFGHTLGATGLMEAIVALEALRRRCAPPTVGLVTPADAANDLHLVRGRSERIATDRTCALSVTYGFGGANSALVLNVGGL